jgi:tetratricopeptide (TPR) repeat protein
MGRQSKRKTNSRISTPSANPPRKQAWLLSVALIVAVAIAYLPAWDGQPIWDDDGHLTKPELRSLSGLKRIWVEPGAAQQYYPLVHTFFWIEYQLWGLQPLGYHLVNIFLHAISAVLLVRILLVLGVPGAWLAGALFALHPVQVESVAWIAELKNTLSGVFYLGAALVYLGFEKQRRGLLWALALFLFVLGLLSKSVIGTLPAALLVVLWWKRGRLEWKGDVLPLTPFFVLAAAAGAFTAWMERAFIGAEGAAFDYSFIERILIAGRAFWFYLSKLAWPLNLIFIYPRWEISQTIWWQYLFPAAAVALITTAWLLRKRSRAPLAALLFFGGTLFPALGFVNIYPFAYSFVADHFQYLACIGLLTLAAAGISTAIPRMPRWAMPSLSVVLLGTLAMLTWRQSTMYADAKTVWNTTLARNPDCWLAYNNRGLAALDEGRLDAAIFDFEAALRSNSESSQAYNNLGIAFNQQGRLERAAASLKKAVEIRPHYADAHFNLAMVLREKGEVDESIVHFEKTLKIRPSDAEALREFGAALLRKGRTSDAILQFQGALSLNPKRPEVLVGLGNAFLQAGRPAEAIAQFQSALEVQPTDVVALNNLAWVLALGSPASVRDGQKAVELAQRAYQLTRGADPNVLRTLSAAYAETGQFQQAAETARQALQIVDNRSPLADALRKEIALYEKRTSP